MDLRTLDISVRISAVGGRDDERLYSDENQETACRDLITKKDAQVGIVTKEKNVSGGKASKDRELEKLVQRIENKESQGIVVYDFSRLSREDPFAAVMLIGRIHNAGGVVYGVSDGFDSSAPMAAVMTALYAEQAHNYLKVMRERSKAGILKARERGAYTAKTPTGYDRAEDGSIVPGAHAAIVKNLFKYKLQGDSYAEMARYAADEGLLITPGGIRKLFANPVYIGKSLSGQSEPLVDEETFKLVQITEHRRKATGNGAKTLCQSIARCANCGSTLIVSKTGGTYQCRGNKLGGCDAKACISIHILDKYVDDMFRSRYHGWLLRAYTDTKALDEADALRRAASFELKELKSSTSLISTVGLKAFEEMIASAAARLEIADAACDAAKQSTDLVEGIARLLDHWDDLDVSEKRRVLAKSLARIDVRKGRVPVEQKVSVIFKGEITLDAPDDAGASLALVHD